MNFMKFKKRKGSLIQTLVLCIILALISAMLLKWVMSRYLLSIRLYKSSQARVRTEGVFMNSMANWNFNIPANGTANFWVDGRTISRTVSGGIPKTVNLVIDEDQ